VVGRVLIVLDGAPEPRGRTTLELALTPHLDRLCRRGVVSRLRTTPAGLEPGSETGIPTLLGSPPKEQLGRGWIEAAAAEVAVLHGERPWRLDLHDVEGRRVEAAAPRGDGRRAGAAGLQPGGRRVDAAALHAAVAERLPRHRVIRLRGHRLLALGEERPVLTAPLDGVEVSVWPDGALPDPAPDSDALVVCGPGAAAGVARLLGFEVHIPLGATGDVDTDLSAKAEAAVRAAADGHEVVLHVGALDEAAHRRDPVAKRRALERVDAQLIAPLAAVADLLAVTSDHSTCPRTGRHGAEPVPLVVAGRGIAPHGPDRLTERASAAEPIATGPWDAVVAGVAA
jgi:2,3-bisphosphoglycerate-independent phosphoglycerate mutase